MGLMVMSVVMVLPYPPPPPPIPRGMLFHHRTNCTMKIVPWLGFCWVVAMIVDRHVRRYNAVVKKMIWTRIVTTPPMNGIVTCTPRAGLLCFDDETGRHVGMHACENPSLSLFLFLSPFYVSQHTVFVL